MPHKRYMLHRINSSLFRFLWLSLSLALPPPPLSRSASFPQTLYDNTLATRAMYTFQSYDDIGSARTEINHGRRESHDLNNAKSLHHTLGNPIKRGVGLRNLGQPGKICAPRAWATNKTRGGASNILVSLAISPILVNCPGQRTTQMIIT